MSQINIEKGVPIPSARRSHQKDWIVQAVGAMSVGDSFLCDFRPNKRGCYALASVLTARLKPKRFAARKTEKGIRIWRVA